MQKFLFLTLLAACTLVATAQKTIRDPNAEKRNATGYHAISVADGIDLYLSQGSESVAVSASGTKYRDRIKTEVKNGVLSIWFESNSNFNINWGNDRKLKAYVSFSDLDKLTASGGSDVDVDGSIKVSGLSLHLSGGSDFYGKVEAGELKVDASGGSDLHISGALKNLDISASGGSDFKGYDLVTDVCNLNASGGSDIYITVNKELTVDASGGSDVHYKGDGTVRNIKSDGSSVKKVNH